MYEIAFYLAVHLGVSRIVAVGWDLYSNPEQLKQLLEGHVGQTHFYEPDWQRFEVDSRQAAGCSLEETLERFRGGQMINHHGRIDPQDIVFTALATRHFAAWLHQKGVRLFVTSDSPNVSRTIPRVDLARAGDDGYLDSAADAHTTVSVPTPEYPHFQALRKPAVRILPGDPRLIVGWHPLEHWDGVPTRWSGPGPSSYFLVPVLRGRDLHAMLECIAAPHGELPEVYADGHPLPIEWSQEAGLSRGVGVLRAGEAWDEVYTLIEFRMGRLFLPASEMAGSRDFRRLGFAFRSFCLDPVEP